MSGAILSLGLNNLDHGNVQSRETAYITGLSPVDMTVGVNWILRPHDSAQQLNGAIRQDLIFIPIGLCSRSNFIGHSPRAHFYTMDLMISMSFDSISPTGKFCIGYCVWVSQKVPGAIS
jgi:hypothetical protein